MHMKLAKILQKILMILLICILTMGDVIVIAENSAIMSILDEQKTEVEEELEVEEKLDISQTIITNRMYKIGQTNKKIIQIELKIDANALKSSTLKENKVTLTPPIEDVNPEEIYVSSQNEANFINATWEIVDDKLVIDFTNDELEKIKDDKVDTLILTYIYAENVDVSKIASKASAEGKLYNGKKAICEEITYEIEVAEEIGEFIQITSNMQEIYKTELKKENQEIEENIEINLNYRNLELVDKIVLSEEASKAYTGEIASEVNTKYLATTVNKQELLNVIGENGELIIKSGEDEIFKINKETEADEAGNIFINYEKNISNVTIEISLGEQEDKLGEIKNNRINIKHKIKVEKCDEKANFDKLVKEMTLSLAKDEEVSKILINSVSEIKDKTTKAELGLDKNVLTATQENELTATITLHTEHKKYDLNKNPRYEIVLPKEIEKVEVGEISILNNKDFKVKESQIVENDNEQKVLVIILEGEQTEYTELAGNVQIIIPFKITTKTLIPTTKAAIELYYTNEIAERYETEQNYGKETQEISIISDTDLIVATEAKMGEEKVMSYKTDIATLEMKKTEERQIVEIKGIVINNTDEVKENLKIIGENELLNGVTVSKGNVYYSETAEGPWAETISEGHKFFKIEIEKLEIGEKLDFTYNIQIPEVLEESKEYEAIYEIYQGENVEKESKLVVAVEVEKQEVPEIPEGEISISYSSQIQKYGGSSIEKVEIGSNMVHKITLINNTGKDEEAKVNIKLPECIDKDNISATIYEKDGDEYAFVENIEPETNEDVITYITKVPQGKDKIIYLEFYVGKYISKKVETTINVLIGEKEETFTSKEEALIPADITASIKAYIGEKEIKTDEEITIEKGNTIKYVTIVENKGETKDYIEIREYNKTGFKRVKQQIYIDDVLVSEYGKSDADIFNSERIKIEGNSVIKNVLTLELTKDIDEDTIIEGYSEVISYLEEITTNKINIKLLKKVEKPQEPEIPTEPENPKEEIYFISGIAWLDKDRDGTRGDNEDLLKGVEVVLLNAETNEEITKTITDMNGKYEFKDLNKGKYVIKFGYNTTTYNLTTYQKEGVENSKNSDVILATQEEVNIAKTEVIELNAPVENIDIGLVLKEIFDLEVTKQIKKVTVKNEEGQTVYEYENTDFTKIEIPSKYYKGTNIIIEYEVRIANKGDISGYVKTLTDHKPEGLKFSSELNTSWYEGTDGKLYCIEFGEDEIKSGETREVSLVLKTEIENTQIQYITNEVELEDIFNEYLKEEKDMSNNKAEATLIVAIKTGTVNQYLGLWLACAVIIGTGIYLINKRIVIKR